MKKDNDKLRTWQERLATNEAAYQSELAKMDKREALYQGDRNMKAIVSGDVKTEAVHVRNIVAEIIEAQIDSSIPQPKVTARHKRDERLAKIAEDMLRNEIDRLPFEFMNDMAERTVPIQGSVDYLVEWDNTQRTHTTVGELTICNLHPKQVIPQDGVYTGIEDMDYIILKVPQTKAYIKRRYGVDVIDEGESEPEIKGAKTGAEDMVTQYVAYYRNDSGGIGKFSWVNDTTLEDMDDYQARRLKRCTKCKQVYDPTLQPMEPTLDGTAPTEEKPKDKDVCPFCGSTSFEETEEDFETLTHDIVRTDGSVIPAMKVNQESIINPMTGLPTVITTQEPTQIPYYKPNIFPVIQQKNVSVYGHFGGDSDVDKIADQQNTTNRVSAKIIDKLLKSGSYMTLPDDAYIEVSAEDMKVIRPGDPSKMAMINTFDLEGNVSQDMTYLQQVYEEARQVIGITDSFQGRRDTTATSGKAKEFAAAQSAGRLESKRRMKDAAYAAIYEAMFKFVLAYADEPRPVVSQDSHGQPVYSEFNKYDFLEQDEAGEWYWNDQFLFSCDSASGLANNREAMWQETRLNFQSGAFGNPQDPNTLILFWTKMSLLHYPGAEDTLDYLQEMQLRQQQMQMMQMQQQAQMAQRQEMLQREQMAQQQRMQGAAIQAAREDAQREAAAKRIADIQSQQKGGGQYGAV